MLFVPRLQLKVGERVYMRVKKWVSQLDRVQGYYIAHFLPREQ